MKQLLSQRRVPFGPMGVAVLVGLLAALVIPTLVLAQTSQQATITEKEFSLTPAAISVPRGQPVRFTVTNAGTVEHNFKVENPGQKIEQTLFATNLKPGETRTATFTFTVAGDWEMYCPVDKHEDLGMKGTIDVVAASGQAATPTRLPQTGGVPLAVEALVGLVGVVVIGGGMALQRRLRPRA